MTLEIEATMLLSELIKLAQAAKTKHGDLTVYVSTTVAGYEYNETCTELAALFTDVDEENRFVVSN